MTQRMQAQYVQFYIDGSTAKKIQPVTPKKEKPVQKTKIQMQARTKIYVDPVAIFSVVVALCMILTIAVGMIRLNVTNRQVEQMENYVVYMHRQYKTIKNQYEDSYKIEDIEKTALALGMVPADQIESQTLMLDAPTAVEEPTLWESVGTFLTGLFA